MSIYKNDNPQYLEIALDSIIGQTLKPKEIVVVGDGPVPEALEKCIQRAKEAAAVEGIALKWLPQPVTTAAMTISPVWTATTSVCQTALRNRCGCSTSILKSAWSGE